MSLEVPLISQPDSSSLDVKEDSQADPAKPTYFGVQPTTKIGRYTSRKITLLQFWGIVAVVYTHAYNGYPRPLEPHNTYNPVNFVIAFEYFLAGGALRFAVPMFFTMSGFLFFVHKKYDKPDFNFGKRIRSRIKSILLPYLLWDIVAYLCVVLILLLIPKSQTLWPWFNFRVSPSTYAFPQILYTIRDTLITPVPYQLWYLRDLFLLVLQTPLFFFLHRKMKCLWIVPAIVVIPWLCDLWPLKWFGLYILDLDGYLFFPIGSLLALYGIDIERKISFKSTLAFFVLPWLACNTAKAVIATFEDSTGPTKILFLDIKVLLYKISLPFGVLSVWFLYDHVVNFQNKRENVRRIVNGNLVEVSSESHTATLLNVLTPYTLWIYCSHEPVMGYLLEIMQPFLGLCKLINPGSVEPSKAQKCIHVANPAWFLLIYMVTPIIWICYLVFLGSLIKRCSPKAFALLTGGRVAKKK